MVVTSFNNKNVNLSLFYFLHPKTVLDLWISIKSLFLREYEEGNSEGIFFMNFDCSNLLKMIWEWHKTWMFEIYIFLFRQYLHFADIKFR